MTNKLPVASHLNDSEYKLLLNVHNKHVITMGLEQRTEYRFKDITKVNRNTKEVCLEVYYSNGEWFKYYPNGTWA